jgi:hypothetical protein
MGVRCPDLARDAGARSRISSRFKDEATQKLFLSAPVSSGEASAVGNVTGAIKKCL